MAKFKPEDIFDLHGRVAIVTGGNRGMSYHIVQQLASHGAKVYMAARSEASAREAIQRMEAEKPELQGKDRVVYLKLDLSTLKSAQDSANEYLQLEQRVDIIVHNAEIRAMGWRTLWESITSRPFDVRVVIVSSMIHSRAPAAGRFATLDEVNDPLAPPSSQDGIRSPWPALLPFCPSPQRNLTLPLQHLSPCGAATGAGTLRFTTSNWPFNKPKQIYLSHLAGELRKVAMCSQGSPTSV
ncbi:hypothetical protein AB1N83_010153 [Pleurotus pulmonarius]